VIHLVQISEITNFADKKGIIISKDALDVLIKKPDWKEIIQIASKTDNPIINKDVLSKQMLKTKFSGVQPEVEIIKSRFNAYVKDRTPNFRIMDEYDVTGKSHCEGKKEDFLRLFRSKYKLISAMLQERHNLSPIKIKDLKGVAKNENIDLIGMINKKWTTKNNHIAFEIEDMENKCIVLVMEKEKDLMKKAEHVLEDNVVGFKGVKIGDDFVILKEFYWPDVPIGSVKLIDEDIYTGCTSDFHIGSDKYLEKPVKKWLDYLNGKNVTGKILEKVGRMQYLFVVGDNVSGIGVYPGQVDELEIKDIYKQYEAFEDVMLQIPEYIQVFICPGQHDAVRRAEPQPAVPKEFMPRLYGQKNFHFIASPSWVETEGLKNLVYHGPSIHDLISSVSFLNMNQPQEGMVELLKKRDLMPKYGGRNPYVPEERDYMVIKEVPDFVFIGDMHHNGYSTYRGTTIVNGGTWEAQTDFQKKIGHHPTPGVFPMINLKTRKISETYFMRDNLEKEVESNES
jgi:DNA polymerase II small subunit